MELMEAPAAAAGGRRGPSDNLEKSCAGRKRCSRGKRFSRSSRCRARRLLMWGVLSQLSLRIRLRYLLHSSRVCPSLAASESQHIAFPQCVFVRGTDGFLRQKGGFVLSERCVVPVRGDNPACTVREKPGKSQNR